MFLFIEFFRTTPGFLKVEKFNWHKRVTEVWNTGKYFSASNFRIASRQEKKWEKLRQFSDVFARTFIVSTHRTHLHQSANNATQVSMLRASEANARERRRKVKERPSYSCFSPAPFSSSSFYRVLPSLDSTNRKGTACNRVKDWCSYRLHAYRCLDMAHWKPAFRGVNVKKFACGKMIRPIERCFFTCQKNNTSNRKHSGA